MRAESRSPVLALAPVLALGPALTCFVPRIMAVLYILSTLAFLITDWRMRGHKPQFDKTLLAVFGGFIVYGLASYYWAIAPDAVFEKTGQFLIIFGPLVFVAPGLQRLNSDDIALIGKLLLMGLGLGLLVFTFEALSDFALYDLVRGSHSLDSQDVKQNKPAALLVMWLLMCLPWLLGKNMRQIIVVIIALCWTLYAVNEAESSSTGVIFFMSPILMAAIALIPVRAVLKMAFAMLMGITILMPIAARHIYLDTPWQQAPLPNSFLSRIEIWDQAARRSFEKPILGWGLDSSPSLPNRNEASVLIHDGEKGVPIAHLHPHNAPIQVWFELGALGIAFVLALMGVMYRRIHRLNGPAQRHAIFMASTLFLYTLSIWGIWQTWFLATLCLFGLMAQAGARHLGFVKPLGS